MITLGRRAGEGGAMSPLGPGRRCWGEGAMPPSGHDGFSGNGSFLQSVAADLSCRLATTRISPLPLLILIVVWQRLVFTVCRCNSESSSGNDSILQSVATDLSRRLATIRFCSLWLLILGHTACVVLLQLNINDIYTAGGLLAGKQS